MDYMFSETDCNGYIHSIDNFIATYYVENIGVKCLDKIIEDIKGLKEKYPHIVYWEKMNLNPCRKYSFYQHAIHLDDGIYVLLGHYSDFDKEQKKFTVFPMIRLELNPNKHGKKPVFIEFMNIIETYCYDCTVNRYDYAIDIPVAPDKVKVFGTNKEKGLYKGTRYFGQRNRNGYCRIYDKAEEQGLDSPLTRVEHVFSLTKTTKNISFEKIFIENQKAENKDENEKITSNDKVIIDLCNLCRSNGLEYDEILQQLNFRKRCKIENYLNSNGYSRLEFNTEIHNRLFEMVKKFFNVRNDVSVDASGQLTVNNDFVELEDDEELPFD